MLKALVIKELRESAGLVVLAVIGAAYVLGELTATPVVPWQSKYLYSYPFVADWLFYETNLVYLHTPMKTIA